MLSCCPASTDLILELLDPAIYCVTSLPLSSLMADRLANVLEKLAKGGSDMEKVADILEQSCSKKCEPKPGN